MRLIQEFLNNCEKHSVWRLSGERSDSPNWPGRAGDARGLAGTSLALRRSLPRWQFSWCCWSFLHPVLEQCGGVRCYPRSAADCTTTHPIGLLYTCTHNLYSLSQIVTQSSYTAVQSNEVFLKQTWFPPPWPATRASPGVAAGDGANQCLEFCGVPGRAGLRSYVSNKCLASLAPCTEQDSTVRSSTHRHQFSNLHKD